MKVACLSTELHSVFLRDVMKQAEEDAQRRGKLFFVFQFFPRSRKAVSLDIPPRQLSTAILRLMTCAHNLKVETRRWHGTLHEEWLCRRCHVVEDEKHAVFECLCYIVHREALFANIGFTLDKPCEEVVNYAKSSYSVKISPVT